MRVDRARLRPRDARLPRTRREAPPGEERRPGPPPRPYPTGRGAHGVTQAREGAAAQGPPRGLAREDDAGRDRKLREDRRSPSGRAGLRAGKLAASGASQGFIPPYRAGLLIPQTGYRPRTDRIKYGG